MPFTLKRDSGGGGSFPTGLEGDPGLGFAPGIISAGESIGAGLREILQQRDAKKKRDKKTKEGYRSILKGFAATEKARYESLDPNDHIGRTSARESFELAEDLLAEDNIDNMRIGIEDISADQSFIRERERLLEDRRIKQDRDNLLRSEAEGLLGTFTGLADANPDDYNIRDRRESLLSATESGDNQSMTQAIIDAKEYVNRLNAQRTEGVRQAEEYEKQRGAEIARKSLEVDDAFISSIIPEDAPKVSSNTIETVNPKTGEKTSSTTFKATLNVDRGEAINKIVEKMGGTEGLTTDQVLEQRSRAAAAYDNYAERIKDGLAAEAEKINRSWKDLDIEFHSKADRTAATEAVLPVISMIDTSSRLEAIAKRLAPYLLAGKGPGDANARAFSGIINQLELLTVGPVREALGDSGNMSETERKVFRKFLSGDASVDEIFPFAGKVIAAIEHARDKLIHDAIVNLKAINVVGDGREKILGQFVMTEYEAKTRKEAGGRIVGYLEPVGEVDLMLRQKSTQEIDKSIESILSKAAGEKDKKPTKTKHGNILVPHISDEVDLSALRDLVRSKTGDESFEIDTTTIGDSGYTKSIWNQLGKEARKHLREDKELMDSLRQLIQERGRRAEADFSNLTESKGYPEIIKDKAFEAFDFLFNKDDLASLIAKTGGNIEGALPWLPDWITPGVTTGSTIISKDDIEDYVGGEVSWGRTMNQDVIKRRNLYKEIKKSVDDRVPLTDLEKERMQHLREVSRDTGLTVKDKAELKILEFRNLNTTDHNVYTSDDLWGLADLASYLIPAGVAGKAALKGTRKGVGGVTEKLNESLRDPFKGTKSKWNKKRKDAKVKTASNAIPNAKFKDSRIQGQFDEIVSGLKPRKIAKVNEEVGRFNQEVAKLEDKSKILKSKLDKAEKDLDVAAAKGVDSVYRAAVSKVDDLKKSIKDVESSRNKLESNLVRSVKKIRDDTIVNKGAEWTGDKISRWNWSSAIIRELKKILKDKDK